jgi:hypothetical protein
MTHLPVMTLDEWLAQKPRVSVALSEGGCIAAVVIELDGRVLLTESRWLHMMMPHVFMHVLPRENGWVFRP